MIIIGHFFFENWWFSSIVIIIYLSKCSESNFDGSINSNRPLCTDDKRLPLLFEPIQKEEKNENLNDLIWRTMDYYGVYLFDMR